MRRNNGRGRKRPNNRRTPSNRVHLYSKVESVLTLKSKHKKRERYPLLLSDLFDPAAVGMDTDIRAVGYTVVVQIATGNDVSTVSLNLAHAGNWVRAGGTDGFNQAFSSRNFRRGRTIVFKKRVLPRSEREFLSPQNDPTSGFVLQVDDPLGVIPGVSLKLTTTIHFIRAHLPTKLTDPDGDATDKYADQNVISGGINPPSSQNDVPKLIEYNSDVYRTSDIDSPLTYSSNATQTTFTVTQPGKLNIVGYFVTSRTTPDLQQAYTDSGFEGQIRKQN